MVFHGRRRRNDDGGRGRLGVSILSRTTVGLLCFLLLGTTTTTTCDAYHQPFGLQAGNSRSSSFATSMVYNEQNHEIAIVGATVGDYFRPDQDQQTDNSSSDCFVAVLRLPHVDASGKMTDPNQLSWIRRRQYGTSAAQESCSDLVWNENDGSIVAVGHTAGQQGLLTSLLPHGNDHRPVYGTVLDVSSAVKLQGGMLLHSNQVQFPLAIARDDQTRNNLYVVDLFSEHVDDSFDMDNDPGFFAAGGLSKGGIWKDASFALRIQKIQPIANHEEDQAAFSSMWLREYGTMQQESVMVSSLTYVEDRLIMTGYTAGSSSAFGESQHRDDDGDGTSDIVDSFLTLFDAETGDLGQVLRMTADGDEGNLRVMQLCHQEKTNTENGNSMPVSSVFVVGTTELIQRNTSFAFVQKVNLATMEVEWNREIHGILFPPTHKEGVGPQVHGVACAVTSDGKDVYIAGNIMDGSILQGDDRRLRQSTHDRNLAGDIFVAKFDTSEGNKAFSREIGSDGNDSVAPGKSLATDVEGNLIVIANTVGSLYHQKVSPEGSSEILVFSIGREKGDFYTPHPRSKESEISADDSTQAESRDRHEKFLVATYALLSLLMVVSIVVGTLYWRHNRPKNREYRSGLHEYEGIWRTAAFDPGMTDDRIMLVGRRESAREQRYSEIDRARRLSATRSATSFPLGSYCSSDEDGEERNGDVYDLLAKATERYSKVLADDQARARERLAQAVRAATSFDEEDIPDISK